MAEFIPQHVPSIPCAFTRGYLTAAEWLLPDDTDRTAIAGWAPGAFGFAMSECEAFQQANADKLARYSELSERGWEHAGHDFYLSRNGHGAGFFDRGDDPVFTELQDAAEACGDSEAYVGDDGYLYLS